MPKRTDLKKILVIGAGPIVIGQACEFDYSGTQACKALKEEGYKVVLWNSNPATIMTDPETADATYIEPISVEFLDKILEKEKPCAILPTLGGQTALNVAFEASKQGVIKKHGVELIGANEEVIARAEDRELFKETMRKAGIDLPKSVTVHTMEEALAEIAGIGFPCVIRPAFTLGGKGGGIAYNMEEYKTIVHNGIKASIIGEVLIEEGLIGWKEFEMEVMRDSKDNTLIVCSIENVDPMGVHTGDSITVAPVQTMTDKEYQRMRDQSLRVLRAIGVECGGSNVQFGLNPKDGRLIIIEMNPRVSRSSALASKATGFPIAKIAAKLAVGYALDEIPNDITRETPASFEPSIDYCVVKIPRFAFEKFPDADPTLTTSMKSVGEVMAIGRTFKEALQKGLRGLEIRKDGLEADIDMKQIKTKKAELTKQVVASLVKPNARRIFAVGDAFRLGLSVEDVYGYTKIDHWFLRNMKELIDFEAQLAGKKLPDAEKMKKAKELGFSDRQIARLCASSDEAVALARKKMGIECAYKLVDTCAAEFEAKTPYFYSTYDNTEDEIRKTDKKKVMILGGGPNRIGQGIEFDYCCVHASYALRQIGVESIMVNCNPETVSTDYDTSDKLYFEPVTLEDVLAIVAKEKPYGVILQFGGQTPLNLALGLEKAGVRILGTKAKAIDISEDREKFKNFLDKLKLRQAASGIATSVKDARKIALTIGFPCMVRPSYVLGGRAMRIVYDEDSFDQFAAEAMAAAPNQQILVDKYLEGAIELDVDVLGDGKDFVIGGILEHIEEAGIHSGDSAMCLPPHTLGEDIIAEVRRASIAMAKELKIVGLMNVQYAVQNGKLFVIEVNPRASRTVPFISKAIGRPLPNYATKIMLGATLKDLKFTEEVKIPYKCVKESVFVFNRFPGTDIRLGPEMKSTGEVMGIDKDFAAAYAKSQLAAYQDLPTSGSVFISVRHNDKRAVVPIARELSSMGFNIISTTGTANLLQNAGIDVKVLNKVSEGRPNILDYIINKDVHLVINTPSGNAPRQDEVSIRAEATRYNIPCITTISGAEASVQAIAFLRKKQLTVTSIQQYHKKLA
jgi:carbamoyl-phosphate synthase large subunit